MVSIIGIFLRYGSIGKNVSTLPQELIGIWTGQKVADEPPKYDRRLTIFPDGIYALRILSTEGPDRSGETSHGTKKRQEDIEGTIIVNGFYIILQRTSTKIDGLQIPVDNTPEEKYTWRIFMNESQSAVGLRLDGGDTSHFFYREKVGNEEIDRKTESL